MKAFGLTIETLFHEKILLYGELLDVLEQEKKSITEIDIESLWEISEKKQQIALRIENIRKMIRVITTMMVFGFWFLCCIPTKMNLSSKTG